MDEKRNTTKRDKEMLRDSLNMMTYVVDDAVELVAYEKGVMSLDIAPFSLPKLVEQVYEMERPYAIAKNITMRWSVTDDVPQSLFGDATRIRQLLVNLISNAIKFTGNNPNVTPSNNNNNNNGNNGNGHTTLRKRDGTTNKTPNAATTNKSKKPAHKNNKKSGVDNEENNDDSLAPAIRIDVRVVPSNEALGNGIEPAIEMKSSTPDGSSGPLSSARADVPEVKTATSGSIISNNPIIPLTPSPLSLSQRAGASTLKIPVPTDAKIARADYPAATEYVFLEIRITDKVASHSPARSSPNQLYL
jgi:hypothetical protein